ncbi:ankyrin repeat-containing domain-containing [Fusarium albosuccineum]|uniref:Ankyrin repeat-containing domain-containing n=1 Tax=Fusarium albosuccineum TaxID=1237068 RepID=A0A8H4L757_9HYPO|nr:ankyrin repeat-containing domain-containing [Fusarium albosuccineum]
MLLTTYLVGLFLILPVRADAWGDFSNNLATDLAPLLSLFGEQITKQFLSESTSRLDNFIFAMAPMGILTAVVSAIRVCGSPSLRAFVGRAQEGRGNAEAELCSSTSRDVCELYNNGGIARVFGRPKILEVVYDPPVSADPDSENKSGIYTFQEYLDSNNGKTEWGGKQENGKDPEKNDTFAPNLSLNVGIRRRPRPVFWAVAAMGLTLQAGVLVFAVVVAYVLQWDKDGNRPNPYACPLVIAGTIMLCYGCFLCAFLVDKSTEEQFFRRRTTREKRRASMYWVQPGGQTLGDQTFDSFCYSDHDKPLDKYITSWKNPSENWARKSELAVWVAVGTTVSGFVLQFVGLRGIHSAVSVAQLGAILVMSAARAGLRMQRLSPEDNYLRRYLDAVIGHELDWLALRIGRQRTPTSGRLLWKFCSPKEITKECPSTSDSTNTAAELLLYRTRLAELTRSPKSPTRTAESAACFGDDMIVVREWAMRLARAMESAINTVYSKSPKIREGWDETTSMYWSFVCNVSDIPDETEQETTTHTLFLELTRKTSKSPWALQNELELEGLLGLWVWSLKFDPAVEILDSRSQLKLSRASGLPTRRIVTTNQHLTEPDLKIWFGSMAPTFIEDELLHNSVNFCNASAIWKRDQRRDETLGNKDQPLPDKHLEHEIRIVGWPATELPRSPCPRTFKFWSADTEGSFSSLCTQEIFGSFIRSILNVVSDFGDIHVATETEDFRAANGLVSDLTNLFVENELGPRKDASLCILPPFIHHLMLSSPASVLAAAKKSADHYRKANRWKDAQTLLIWAWRHYHGYSLCDSSSAELLSDDYSQEATTALGEFYLWALCNDTTREFGIEGIKCFAGRPLSRGAKMVVDDYSGLAAKVNDAQGGLGLGIENGLVAISIHLAQSPSTTAEEKGQMLCSAAKNSWMEVTLVLLESGAEPDFKDSDGQTPLWLAAERGYETTVELLLATGKVDVNAPDKDGQTALCRAAYEGHQSVVQLLLDRGAAIEWKMSERSRPLLSQAAYEGREDIVQLLLHNGADIELRNELQLRTPVWWAAYKGHEAVVELLLDKGAVIDIRDSWRETPLFWAATKGHEAVVNLLLQRGADIEAKNVDGRTPLWQAAKEGNVAMAKLLLDNGADITTRNNSGETLSDIASRKCHGRVVKVLRETQDNRLVSGD